MTHISRAAISRAYIVSVDTSRIPRARFEKREVAEERGAVAMAGAMHELFHHLDGSAFKPRVPIRATSAPPPPAYRPKECAIFEHQSGRMAIVAFADGCKEPEGLDFAMIEALITQRRKCIIDFDAMRNEKGGLDLPKRNFAYIQLTPRLA
jgi:hypothetical protein